MSYVKENIKDSFDRDTRMLFSMKAAYFELKRFFSLLI